MLEALGETGLIFREEIRRAVRRKGYVIVALSVPVLLLALLVVVPGIRAIVESRDKDDPKPIGIVNLAPRLSPRIEARPGILEFAGREDGIEALAEEKIEELFVIPQDYLTTGRVEWLHGSAGTSPGASSAATVTALLRVALAAEELPPEVLSRALAPAVYERARLGPQGLPLDEDENAVLGGVIVSLVSTGLLMFAILIGAGGLVQSVAEEKENRMIEVLLTSARPLSVMAAKVLAFGIAGLALTVVWVGSLLAIAPRIFASFPDAPILSAGPALLAWVAAFFVAGYFFSAVIMAAVGAATAGVKEANQLSMLVILPQLLVVQALLVFFSNPDGAMARTLSLIPFTAPVASMMRLAIGDPSPMELVASLALMAVCGAALLWVAARVFRTGLLMYGQRMSIGRIVATLREAG